MGDGAGGGCDDKARGGSRPIEMRLGADHSGLRQPAETVARTEADQYQLVSKAAGRCHQRQRKIRSMRPMAAMMTSRRPIAANNATGREDGEAGGGWRGHHIERWIMAYEADGRPKRPSEKMMMIYWIIL